MRCHYYLFSQTVWLHITASSSKCTYYIVAAQQHLLHMWTFCTCSKCTYAANAAVKLLGAPMYLGHLILQERDLSQYSPSLSSTSRHLSCSHQLCELGPNCKNLQEPCPYIATYDDPAANTSSSGFLVEDTLHLDSVSENATRRRVQASVIIGCLCYSRLVIFLILCFASSFGSYSLIFFV